MTGPKAPAGPEGAVKPTGGRLYNQKALKIVFCRENVSFSASLFFETVLLDVRIKMKNVFNK
jgi:hypothetical protein